MYRIFALKRQRRNAAKEGKTQIRLCSAAEPAEVAEAVEAAELR